MRRLKPNAPSEDLHRFFRRMTRLTVLTDSGIVSLQVRALLVPSLPKKKLANEMIAPQRDSDQRPQHPPSPKPPFKQRNGNFSGHAINWRMSAVASSIFRWRTVSSIRGSEIQLQLSNLAAIDAQLLEREARLAVRSQILRDDAFELQVLRREIAALREQRFLRNGTHGQPRTR